MHSGISARRYRAKHALDFIVAASGLTVLAPLFGLLALGVRIDSPGPAFYTQLRSGERGRRFRIYKFRTMVVDADQKLDEFMHLNLHAHGAGDQRLYKFEGDPRVTRLGRFLRRYSLDELPQLLNVLKGDMSLVGPRPLTPEEDRYVVGTARLRATVKPGITGPWQVGGRNNLSFDEMMRLDCMYVTTWSFVRDLRYLALTLPAVCHPESPC